MHKLSSQWSATHTSVRSFPCSNKRFFSNVRNVKVGIFQQTLATSSVTPVDYLQLRQKKVAFPGRYTWTSNGLIYIEKRSTATLDVYHSYIQDITSVLLANMFAAGIVIFSESRWRNISHVGAGIQVLTVPEQRRV